MDIRFRINCLLHSRISTALLGCVLIAASSMMIFAADKKAPPVDNGWTTEIDAGKPIDWSANIRQRIKMPGKLIDANLVNEWEQYYAQGQAGKFAVVVQYKRDLPKVEVAVVNIAESKEVGRFLVASTEERFVVSPDGQFVASIDMDPRPVPVVLRETATGKEIYHAVGKAKGAALESRPVGFNANGQLIVSTVSELFLVDPKDGRESKPAGTREVGNNHASAVSPGGKLLARAGTGGFGLYDALTLKRIGGINQKFTSVAGVLFSQDGAKLAVATRDPAGISIDIFDVATSKPLATGTGPSSGSNANFATMSTSDGGWCFEGTLFDSAGKHVATFPKDAVNSNSVVMMLAGATTSKQWLIARGEFTRGFTIYASDVEQSILPIVDIPPTKTVTLVAKDPKSADDARLPQAKMGAGDLLIGDCNDAIQVFDLRTGAQKAKLPHLPGANKAFSISPDGSLLSYVNPKSFIVVVHLPDLKQVASFKAPSGHAGWISPSNKTIACLVAEKNLSRVVLFQLPAGKQDRACGIPPIYLSAAAILVGDNQLLMSLEKEKCLLVSLDMSSNTQKEISTGLESNAFVNAQLSGEKYVVLQGAWLDFATGQVVAAESGGDSDASSKCDWIIFNSNDFVSLCKNTDPCPIRLLRKPAGAKSVVHLSRDGKSLFLHDYEQRTVKIYEIQSLLDAKIIPAGK